MSGEQLQLFGDDDRHLWWKEPVFEFHCTILRDGSVVNDNVCHGSTFAEAYEALVAVRAELDRQIAGRRACPFNPKYGDGGASLGPDAELWGPQDLVRAAMRAVAALESPHADKVFVGKDTTKADVIAMLREGLDG